MIHAGASKAARRLWAAGLLFVALLPSAASRAEQLLWHGTIRSDLDGDGVAAADEPGIAGVFVSNGLDLVRSDEEGRYSLPARPGDELRVTCPDDFRCPDRHRHGDGDFALRPDPRPDDFFFVQISDAHVFGEIEDFSRYSAPKIPGWIPDFLRSLLAYRYLERLYPEHDRDSLAEGFREALPDPDAHRSASAAEVYEAWWASLMQDALPAGSPRSQVLAAFEEVGHLHPSFVVSTGDLWLEGNRADPDAARRWAALYDEAGAKLGVPIYNTIGNNELTGSQNEAVSPEDPGFGKAIFEARYGPTLYSFDEGPFHFVALDTHRITQREGEKTWWDDYHYSNPVRSWLTAELAAHAEGLVVVLNHEPFHYDPSWSFDDPEWAVDEGLFERYGVDYVLAGHVHRNGFEDSPTGTTHITTGALSGVRWVIPAGIHERGYRLFYAREGRLYSAWKRLHAPLVGFVTPVDPERRAPHHPASKHPPDARSLDGVVEVVVVAADTDGPFPTLRLTLAGEPIDLERWGDYFARAWIDANALPAEGARLQLTAERAAATSDGDPGPPPTRLEAGLVISPAPAH